MPAAPVPTDTLDTRQLLSVLTAMKKGDFSVRLPLDQTGVAGKIADTLNDVIELNQKLHNELQRISTVVGKEGKTTQRASIGGGRRFVGRLYGLGQYPRRGSR